MIMMVISIIMMRLMEIMMIIMITKGMVMMKSNGRNIMTS